MRASILWAFCLLCSIVQIQGHAYVYWPVSRNYLKVPSDAQSQNGPGNGVAINPASGVGNYKTQWGAPPHGDDDVHWAYDLCGQGPNTYLQKPGMSWKDWGGPPVATYKEGGNISFIIAVNAEHGGAHEFRLCPKKLDGSFTVQTAAECLDSVFIGRLPTPGDGCGYKSDGCKTTTPHREASDPFFAHGPPKHLLNGAYELTFTLPKGVSCEHCTVQWFWDTAFGEWFRNCIDIKIEAGSSPTEKPKDSRRRTDPPRRRRSQRRRGAPRRRRSQRRRSPPRRRRRRSERRRRRKSSRRRSSNQVSSSPNGVVDMKTLKYHSTVADVEFVKRGCFPLLDDIHEYRNLRDLTCRVRQASSCRSGLPFFRLLVERKNEVKLCLSFCSSKGADVFGLIWQEDASAQGQAQSECRCGVSETNYNFWKSNGLPQGSPHASLLLDSATKLKECSPTMDQRMYSQVQVYDYTGWKRHGNGVQDALIDVDDEDRKYMTSIATGLA